MSSPLRLKVVSALNGRTGVVREGAIRDCPNNTAQSVAVDGRKFGPNDPEVATVLHQLTLLLDATNPGGP